MCQGKINFHLLNPLTKLQTSNFMKVKKNWRMGIYFLSWKRFIPFVRATSAILPGRNFALDTLCWLTKTMADSNGLWNSLPTPHLVLHVSHCASFMLTNKYLSNDNQNYLITVFGQRSWKRCVCGSLLNKDFFCFGAKNPPLKHCPFAIHCPLKGKQKHLSTDLKTFTTDSVFGAWGCTNFTISQHRKDPF